MGKLKELANKVKVLRAAKDAERRGWEDEHERCVRAESEVAEREQFIRDLTRSLEARNDEVERLKAELKRQQTECDSAWREACENNVDVHRAEVARLREQHHAQLVAIGDVSQREREMAADCVTKLDAQVERLQTENASLRAERDAALAEVAEREDYIHGQHRSLKYLEVEVERLQTENASLRASLDAANVRADNAETKAKLDVEAAAAAMVSMYETASHLQDVSARVQTLLAPLLPVDLGAGDRFIKFLKGLDNKPE